MSVHRKISDSLNTLSGEDRAQELEARLKAHRGARPSQEENQRRMEDAHQEEGRDRVYRSFVNESHVRSDILGVDYKESTADRIVEIMGAGQVAEREVHHAIATRTGIPSLDFFLGGGLPSGLIEIFGPESVGKTSLLARIIGAAQEMGKQVMMTSTEFFDGPYLEKNSVDLKQLLIMRSEEGDRVLEAAYQLLKSVSNFVYVIDSATGLRPPNDEFDNWSKMLLDWMSEVENVMDSGSCVIIVDQVRARKSVDPSKFFAGGTDSVARKIAGIFSTRLELSRASITETTYDMVVNVVANTLKAPAKVFSLPVVKGEGIDVCRDLVRVATAVGVIEQRGTWYSWSGDNIGQGEVEAAHYLSGATWARESIVDQTLRALARG